jgi:hypothetical protein
MHQDRQAVSLGMAAPDPKTLDLLWDALNLQPTPEGGLVPSFDADALLRLADLLTARGDPRAADVRELGAAR